MTRTVAFALIAWWTVIVSTPAARAHESRPLYVEVIETAPLVFSVRWKIPPSVDSRNAPDILMPDICAAATATAGSGTLRRRQYRCDTDPAGSELGIAYPAFNPSVSALFRISRLSGEKHSILAAPEQSVVLLPAQESFASVARDYLKLGIQHILEGYDHLLFLVCLLLIAGTGRRIVITVTGFTIAHSITLALSALGVVKVPIRPVEAAIALSIVFLALEIVRGDKQSLTYRYPIAVSASFGLLHGFGFAAVLGETGLPQTEIPAALLFFNVGVEVGANPAQPRSLHRHPPPATDSCRVRGREPRGLLDGRTGRLVLGSLIDIFDSLRHSRELVVVVHLALALRLGGSLFLFGPCLLRGEIEALFHRTHGAVDHPRVTVGVVDVDRLLAATAHTDLRGQLPRPVRVENRKVEVLLGAREVEHRALLHGRRCMLVVLAGPSDGRNHQHQAKASQQLHLPLVMPVLRQGRQTFLDAQTSTGSVRRATVVELCIAYLG